MTDQAMTDVIIPRWVARRPRAPRGHLGVRLHWRQELRVTGVDGQQVPDIIAINPHDMYERLSLAATRLISGEWNLTRLRVVVTRSEP